MSNVTVSEFKAWKRVEASIDDTIIQSAINAAEAAVNTHCRRSLAPYATNATARKYVGDGSSLLWVHDIGTTSGLIVVNATTTVAANAYQLEPLNGITPSGMSVPHCCIRLIDGTGWDIGNYGAATITITAKWGWPAASTTALPYQYSEAVKILAADVLDQRDIRNGVVAFTEYAAVRVRENPMASMLLEDLRHPLQQWGIA